MNKSFQEYEDSKPGCLGIIVALPLRFIVWLFKIEPLKPSFNWKKDYD